MRARSKKGPQKMVIVANDEDIYATFDIFNFHHHFISEKNLSRSARAYGSCHIRDIAEPVISLK